MLEIDASRLALLNKLKQQEAFQLQMIAELKDFLQVYLEFDSDPEKAGDDLAGKLSKLLGGIGQKGKQKSHDKFINAFEEINERQNAPGRPRSCISSARDAICSPQSSLSLVRGVRRWASCSRR